MTEGFIEPQRDRTIFEMEHQETWYINRMSLGWDWIDRNTKEKIYVLFHDHKFSVDEYDSWYDDWDTYDVQITCIVNDSTKIYKILWTPKVEWINLSNQSRDIFTILNPGKEIIQDYNAKRENMDSDELYEEVFNLMENVLEQDEEDETQDEMYGRAWNNFANNICDILSVYERHQIERCLVKISILSQNRQNHRELLEYLSDSVKCKEYINKLLSDEYKIEGYIDNDIQIIVNTIGILYDKQYVWTNVQVKDEQKSNKKDIEKLKWELITAESLENYELAAKIQKELDELEKNDQGEI